jgi:putative PIN family toxin of toxin-antitoxin system
MSGDPARIVVDTNVLISAGLLPNSRSALALAVAFDLYVLAQNEATWAELQEKIVFSKFDRYFGLDGRLKWMARLIQNTEFLDVSATATECRDPQDNKFLGLALDAGAKTIVTGDKDLLVLNPYQGIALNTPAEFLSLHRGPASS